MEPNNQSSKNIDNLISMVNQKLVISSNPGNGSSVVEAEPGAIDLDQLYAEISLLRGANRVLADCLSRKTGVPFKTVTDSAFRVVLATRESNGSDDIYGRRLLPSYNESPSSYVDNDAMLKQLLMQIKIRDEMFLKLASEADVQPSLFPARRFLTRLIASHVEFFDFHSVLDQIRLMNHRTYLSMITRPNGSDFGNYVVQNQLQLERDDQSRRPNKVVQFAKDARGSEVLKRGIKEGFSNEDIEVIFEEIKDDLIHLSMDSNGKFVVGELLSVINGEKFGQVFYHVLLPELENLCYHIHG
ncbi:hypothetical protein Sjap_022707 [Stephania japonica]|uniref:PUM-HD domain-containing protein n=1 Tax=Stephania japonica TaxID=461633 RepID=A0AAP0EPD4_9MAGN